MADTGRRDLEGVDWPDLVPTADESVSEAYFRFLVQNTADIVTVLNRQGMLLYESPSVQRVLGYRPDELIGRSTLEFLHPEDVPEIVAGLTWQGAEANDAPWVQFRFRHKDGSYRLLAGAGRLTRDPSGQEVFITTCRDVSEQALVSQQLQETTDFVNKIFAASHTLALNVYDATGQCIMANDAAGKIIGATREQVLAQNFNRLPSWQNTGLDRLANRVFDEGQEQRQDVHVTTTFGKEVWLECRLMPFAWQNQPHLLLVTEDVTTRKQAELALQATHAALEARVAERTAALQMSQDRLQSLVNAITESAFLMTPDGIVLVANDTVARRLGTTRQTLVGRPVSDFVPASLYADRMAQIRQVIETGQPIQFEDVRLGANIFNSIYPVLDEDGQVAQLAVFGLDITERVSAEQRLQEVGRHLTYAFDRAAIGMAMVWPAGHFWRINDTFADAIGYSRQELERMTYSDITHPEDHDIGNRAVRQMITGEIDSTVVEKRYVHKNGHPVRFRLTSTAIRDEQGQALYLFTQAEDITERTLAREQVQKMLVELQRSNSELEQFAYIASHDLREPLRKVLAFGDRLQAKCGSALDESCRDYLARMQNAAARMQQMIEDLLSYSRVATHARPFERTDLTAPAQEALANLEIAVAESGADVQIGALPAAEVDAAQIRQLLQNLLHNSIKFSQPQVTPRVQVSGRIVEIDTQPVCEIRVQDNGIGFDEKYLDRIFLPFQRLHGLGKYEGSGIGLAVCRKIVDRHGGSITANSALGEGSIFIVHLPQQHAGE